MIKKVVIDKANRLFQLPPDIFSFRKLSEKAKLLNKSELLDLGRFNWPVDSKPFESINNSLKPASAVNLNKLKAAIAEWLLNRHQIQVNDHKEIFIGGSISSIIYKSALAFIDKGDIVFTPDLGLPAYRKVTTLCGGEPVGYSITGKNNWQPDFDRITTRLGRVARLLYLNSPHNPTGAILDSKEIENLMWNAARENLIIINDAAYQSISERTAPSILSFKEAKKIGAEIYSMAYNFGLPSMPLGFAVGHRDIINGLEHAKNICNDFISDGYVEMALEALRQYPSKPLLEARKQIQLSMAEALNLLEKMDLEKAGYETTPFLWAKIEGRKSSTALANMLYRKYRILTAPGNSFGENGEGYLRFSLTAKAETYREAIERLKKTKLSAKLMEEI